MSAVEEAFAKLPSEFRKRVRFAVDLRPERAELPSIGLTSSLGGGFGYGRIVTVYGNKSAGKSSTMLQMVGMEQKKGKVCAWIDSEKAFDSAWAARLGVDVDNLIYSNVQHAVAVGNLMVELIRAGVDIIVLDSVSAVIPDSYTDKGKEEFAGMEKTHKVGSHATNTKAILKAVNYENDNSLIVFISQTTTKITPTFTKQDKEGGNAIDFYSSQVVKLSSSNSNSAAVTRDRPVGNKIMQMHVGREVEWFVEYNKLGVQHGKGKYDFIYDGEEVGVDVDSEVVKIAIEFGLIEKSGSWLKYKSSIKDEEVKGQGEANFLELAKGAGVYEELREDVKSLLG